MTLLGPALFIFVYFGSCAAQQNNPAQTCDRPDIENGRPYYASYEFPQRTNNQIYYICDKGFLTPAKSKSGKVRCTEGGWLPKPKCLKLCPNNGVKVDNAKLLKTLNTYLTGAKVVYKCFKGFTTLDGKDGGERECLPDGRFSPAECIQLTCTIPSTNTVIRKPPGESYTIKTEVTFSCPGGFTLKGSPKSWCSELGWSSPLPTCQEAMSDRSAVKDGNPKDKSNKKSDKSNSATNKKDRKSSGTKEMTNSCGPPPVVTYADLSEQAQDVYPSGSTVVYRCQPRYKLEGNRKIKCKNGVWDDPPICLEPCTPDNSTMEENHITLRWLVPYTLYNEDGEEVEFICLFGYELYPPSELVTTCKRGVLLYPKCVKKEAMSDRSAVKDGNPKDKSNKKSDKSNSATNKKDRKSSGTKETQCTIPSNSNIKPRPLRNRYKINDEVTFSCDRNSNLIGSDTSRCYDDGWRPELPTCEEMTNSCGPPPVVMYADLSEPAQDVYPSGSTVVYRCQTRYKLEGNRKIKCNNGVWDDPPICLEPCTPDNSSMEENHITLRWLVPYTVYNEDGEEVEFICLFGYELYPPSELVTACKRGVLLYPKCVKKEACRLNQDKLDENSLELDPIHGSSVWYGDGDTVQFKCKQGFYNDSSLKGNCSNGELTYPECKRSE
ncbi:complement factor H-related protein 4-like isoform X2 [Ascaphus truei]|uniref:complement factor H-related protein 4-like isoform X2 n=1 Tax=Ascaphus truei TaxID=8439 RepID=UPI003F5A73A4